MSQDLINALQNELNKRTNDLVSNDPTAAYFRGALDALTNRIGIKEDVEQSVGESQNKDG